MISHEYRCIFVHIPRCAGTSIETWLCNQDWWEFEPHTKHLLASQAKELYANWWDDYFKFAVVRNPIDRTRSCLHYSDYFGLRQTPSGISFEEYHSHFGRDIVLEHDYRFSNRSELINDRHQPDAVYCNILDEPLDFIARYEQLGEDMKFIEAKLGVSRPFNHWVEKSRDNHKLNKRDIEAITKMYRLDFEKFGYAIDEFEYRRDING